jgi:hypothetical protein
MSLWAFRSMRNIMPHRVAGMYAMRAHAAPMNAAIVGAQVHRQTMRLSFATSAAPGGATGGASGGKQDEGKQQGSVR